MQFMPEVRTRRLRRGSVDPPRKPEEDQRGQAEEDDHRGQVGAEGHQRHDNGDDQQGQRGPDPEQPGGLGVVAWSRRPRATTSCGSAASELLADALDELFGAGGLGKQIGQGDGAGVVAPVVQQAAMADWA